MQPTPTTASPWRPHFPPHATLAAHRAGDAGRAWTTRAFAAALHVLAAAGAAAGSDEVRQRLHLIVGSAPLPAGLPEALGPLWLEDFVADMVHGALHRHRLLTRLVVLHERRAAFVDGHAPLWVPLRAEFVAALAAIDPTLQALFLAEVGGGGGAPRGLRAVA